MKQILFFLAATALFVTLVGLFFQRSQNAKPTAKVREVKVGQVLVSAEIADNEESRRKGLSGRSALGENQGMLFVFAQKGVKPSFWMKDMLISLDIIWIAGDKIVQIDKNIAAPAAGTPDAELKFIIPKTLIDYVLEVNSGFADKNSLKIGDPVQIPQVP